MNIFELAPEIQELLIKEFAKHITEQRRNLIEKVIKNRTRYVTLVLEDVYQAHNAGAVVRSCDGLGIQDIHVIENRNMLKIKDSTVSKGADKWTNLFYYNDLNTNNTLNCIQNLKKKGYKIAAAALGRHSVKIEQVPLDEPLAIMIGTEKEGLTETACNLADYFIELPMYGFTQSYNLSVCAALILHTLTSRLRESTVNWHLNESDKREILITWFQRCIGHWEHIAKDFLNNLVSKTSTS